MTATTSRWFEPHTAELTYGDLVMLVTSDQKRYLLKLAPKQRLHTHLGAYAHDELVGQTRGSLVLSQSGQEALLIEPSLSDLIKHIKRGTQIIYPKDAAMLVQRLNLRAGSTVLEAGTGSGGLTIALAWSVAPTGHVYTYEARSENAQVARRNLERTNLLPFVTMHERAIDDGFLERDADALFLDVRSPWDHLAHVRAALRPGGSFAALVPTANQVTDLLNGLEDHGFAEIAVEEVLLRAYKPVPERLRPEDSMVAHTGFLVSAQNIVAQLDPSRWQSKERRRYLARRRAAAEIDARSRAHEEDERKYPRMPLP
jgi:tRNA (adenine57-N1/adenine58-N1)-methyltransferase